MVNLKNFLLIAGPCAIENQEVCDRVAGELVKIQGAHPEISVVFKASVDKANRSTAKSYRGLGIEHGLEILSSIRNRFNLPITTDFHAPDQAKMVGEIVDIIQIPAFLCRQTDMLRMAANTGKIVSVKKGQFLSPWDMRHVVEKLHAFGAQDIIQMERGTSFGYGNLVVDMRSFQIMRKNKCPIVYDLTHSLQLPGMGAYETGGTLEFADTLAYAAIGAGIDGLFIETHPNPTAALCDRETQLPLATLSHRVEAYLKLHSTAKGLLRPR
ncbi:MAG: 3-deoxy-8-phosphooctulonate synthase [Puniceicoccales bacterium]|jgi:2-dehydro-3-deoxyphosphooctonate aldolase (KDO 8-P synthase)|nr:3-deoxy-8-phosphooctulonate synthase [Puniceicoccales bacterium]